MCGIFAVIANRPSGLPHDVVARVDDALSAIAHRGPDGRGAWVDQSCTVALGHVRLAVIDVRSEANQPMLSDCGRYAIVFNGEIYNYRELRADLEAQGERFRTTSDTEVLLRLLMRHGPEAISKLNGMWAFLFIDIVAREAIACRDRFGVKPLYTTNRNGLTIFASEAKAIMAYLGEVPPPNRRAVGLYVKYGTCGELPESWFEGITRFEPATWQKLACGGASSAPRSYWTYPRHRDRLPDKDAFSQFRQVLGSAVQIRTRSDVPLGLSLSGGLDSSSIAWLLRADSNLSVDAFCAWFEPEERSELGRARVVCDAFGHRLQPVAEVRSSRIMDDLRTCIYHIDSPHSSTAIVPYHQLCKAARTRLTVMLEGQGADELLLGYPFLYAFATMDFLVRGRVVAAAKTLAGEYRASNARTVIGNMLMHGRHAFRHRHYLRWSPTFLRDPLVRDPGVVEELGWRCTVNNASRALEIEHRNRLRSLLQYGDALSMAVGLESRCPFMDYRVVELGFRLALDQLMRDGFSKWILRKIADRDLPKEIAWPSRKEGFTNQTTQRLREHVRNHGLPADGAELSMSMGLFHHEAVNPAGVLALDDVAFYRIVSVMLWLEAFFASGSTSGFLTSRP